MSIRRALFRLIATWLVLGAPGPLSARTWTVAKDGPDRVLAIALASAAPHDTVRVMKGIYAEGILRINKPVTLIGIGMPVIDGGGQGDVLEITAPDVTVQGFRIQGTLTSSINDNAGIKVVKADRVRLIGNELVHCFFAIHFSESRDLLVEANNIHGDPTLADNDRANGIHLWHCTRALINRNTITDHRDGIYFEFVTDSHIGHNTSLRNIRYGLHFMFSHRDSYTDNLFQDNGAGVAVMYSKNVDMHRNRFISNRGASAYGLLLKEINDVSIEGNEFIDNTTAMLVDGCNRMEAVGNIFRSNGWALRLYSNATACTFRSNVFTGNTFDLATNGNPEYNTLSRNYWDRYKGYDLDRNGTGDVPYRPLSLFAMVNERMPYAVVLSRSLLTGLLDQAERLLPSMTPEDLKDDEPLMEPPHVTRDL